ncbi:MAG: hypothetical protein L0H94_01970 [Nitrospira sp.]|nr:hypothetical protein [Nitrospira sp.]
MAFDSQNDLVRRALALLKKTPADSGRVSTIQVGETISWTRNDGTTHQGCVDCLFSDDTGVQWVLVSVEETWAVVSLKVAANVMKVEAPPL